MKRKKHNEQRKGQRKDWTRRKKLREEVNLIDKVPWLLPRNVNAILMKNMMKEFQFICPGQCNTVVHCTFCN